MSELPKPTGEGKELSQHERDAFRLAQACMRSNCAELSRGDGNIVRWVFKCCGLWDALLSLGAKVKEEK